MTLAKMVLIWLCGLGLISAIAMIEWGRRTRRRIDAKWAAIEAKFAETKQQACAEAQPLWPLPPLGDPLDPLTGLVIPDDHRRSHPAAGLPEPD